MFFNAVVLTAVVGLASAQTASLGGQCAKDADCPAGVSCYAVNSMQIPTCGSFQASCTTDAQCATNLCNAGFCNGALKPSTSGGANNPPLPTTSSAPGSVFLGQQCNPNNPGGNPCAYGASCYAVNAMQIPTCGNFQASCTNNAQCATNTCNNGFCNGPNTPGLTKLGDACSPTLQGTCQNSDCYATNSMLIPRCGNFQASCSSDANCAFNTCNGGLCNGLKPSGSGTNTVTNTATNTGSGGSTYTGSVSNPITYITDSTTYSASNPITYTTLTSSSTQGGGSGATTLTRSTTVPPPTGSASRSAGSTATLVPSNAGSRIVSAAEGIIGAAVFAVLLL